MPLDVKDAISTKLLMVTRCTRCQKKTSKCPVMQISNQEWLTFSICEVQIADVPFASKAPKSIRNSQAMKRDANEMFFSVYSGLSKLSKSSFVFTSFYEKKFAPVYPFGLPVNAIIWTSASRTDISMLSCPASSKSGVPSLFFCW